MAKTICSVSDCGKNAVGRKLCKTHYARFMRNGTLEYVKPLRDMSQDTSTHKACTICLLLKPRTEFHTAARNKDGKRATCKLCTRADNTAHYDLSKDAAAVRNRIYRAAPGYKERMAAYQREYYDNNREDFMENAAERRSREREAFEDSGITVKALRALHGDHCIFCGVTMSFQREVKGNQRPERASIEHMTPLVRGGKHSWANVRLSCISCNCSKNSKTAAEYMEYREASAV